MITSDQSRRFFRTLVFFAIVWLGFGILLHVGSAEAESAFLQVYLFDLLDLIFLIGIFWNMFFSDSSTPGGKRMRSIQISLFIVFKLVCLGLLVITLKRFRNAPFSSLLMGVAFTWIGPMVAGVISRIPFKKGNE